MNAAILVSLTLAMLTPVTYAQSGSAPALEGVWKISEIVTTGANAATISSPQPSLVILSRGHYSYVSVNGSQPRRNLDPPKDPNKLTDAEKLSRYEQWNPFTANAGTFEVKGSTITRHPVVAKNPNVMTASQPIIQDFKLEGNTLWLTSKSAQGQPVSETRTRLTRVK